MIIDTTLREGAQQFGVYFTNEVRHKIALGLIGLGVDELELGWVGADGLAELARDLRPVAGRTVLSVWSPCREADVRQACALGVDRVCIGVPVSDAHIEKRLGLDREGLLERLASVVLAARLFGAGYVSVGLEDVSRADCGFALRAARLARDMGASRIRLSDSVGVLSPAAMMALVRRFRAELSGVALGVHCHDDFGMATANAVSALQAGADYADAALLGLGERAGIAATEELAAYLQFGPNQRREHDYALQGVRDLCALAARAAGLPVPRAKAVAGENVFACESGLHVHALGKSPDLFEPFPPEAVDARRRIGVGAKSGRAAVARALHASGIEIAEERIGQMTEAVRRTASRLGRPLTGRELMDVGSATAAGEE